MRQALFRATRAWVGVSGRPAGGVHGGRGFASGASRPGRRVDAPGGARVVRAPGLPGSPRELRGASAGWATSSRQGQVASAAAEVKGCGLRLQLLPVLHWRLGTEV